MYNTINTFGLPKYVPDKAKPNKFNNEIMVQVCSYQKNNFAT